ncbi:hypothetical protein ACLOJK_029252 [Asimina triloba]
MAGQHHSSSHPIDPAFCKRSSKVEQHPTSPATRSVKPIMHRPATQQASSEHPVRSRQQQRTHQPNPSRRANHLEQQPTSSPAVFVSQLQDPFTRSYASLQQNPIAIGCRFPPSQ